MEVYNFMSGEVFEDVGKIFRQLDIRIYEDDLDKSVYTIIGMYSFRKVKMLVTLVHHY